MLPQEKPAKKKLKLTVKLLTPLPQAASATSRSTRVIDSDEEPDGILDPVGLDDNMDSDDSESEPGEQESSREEEEDKLDLDEGSDQTAVAADEEPSGSPVVSVARKRKRKKASSEHLWMSTFDF